MLPLWLLRMSTALRLGPQQVAVLGALIALTVAVLAASGDVVGVTTAAAGWLVSVALLVLWAIDRPSSD